MVHFRQSVEERGSVDCFGDLTVLSATLSARAHSPTQLAETIGLIPLLFALVLSSLSAPLRGAGYFEDLPKALALVLLTFCSFSPAAIRQN